MSAYADTNFLTRLYLGLAESYEDSPAARMKKAQPFPITWLHQIETRNAIQLYVFRSRSGSTPRVTPEFASATWANFQDDLRLGKLRTVAFSSSDLVRQTEHLSLKYTARQGFRAYDLLHVASALLLECESFWSFDEGANRLARLEGLSSLKA